MRLLLMVMGGLLASQAMAQITSFEAPGNLAPTRDPGCIETGAADNQLSPADLSLGAAACMRKKDYASAVRLIVLMQLRAAFDAQRVTDVTAHQAGQVLGINLIGQIDEADRPVFESAFNALGDNGSAWHRSFCREQTNADPPGYYPAYMIQHGLRAFRGDVENPLKVGFDASSEWASLLRDYLHCE